MKRMNTDSSSYHAHSLFLVVCPAHEITLQMQLRLATWVTDFHCRLLRKVGIAGFDLWWFATLAIPFMDGYSIREKRPFLGNQSVTNG